MELVSIMVPLGICVALPVLITWIYYYAQIQTEKKRTEVLIEAIRAKGDINVDELAKAFAKPRKSAREVLNARLLRGCICTLIGLVLVGSTVVMNLCGWLNAEDSGESITIGLILLAVGISFLIVYKTTKKHVDAAIDNSVNDPK